MLIKCNCTHDYQDKKYGVKMRVSTPTALNGRPAACCTVCGVKQQIKDK